MSAPDIDLTPGVLDAIAGMLQTAAGGLDDLVGVLPAPPDAGDATALVTELLAELVRRAGEVATGSGAAAALIVQCSSAYCDNEAAIAADMDRGLPAAES